MKSIIFICLLISVSLAQEVKEDTSEEVQQQQRTVRAPQGHLQYSDPDGLKVNWKFYTPTQWRSQYSVQPDSSNLRNQRAEQGTAQPTLGYQADLIRPYVTPAPAASVEAPVTEKPAQPIHQVQVHYKPYSMVPSHIKQLILEMYEPQAPYIDPAVFVYPNIQQQQEEQQKKQQAEKEAEEAAAKSATQQQFNSGFSRFEHASKYPNKYPANKAKVSFAQYAQFSDEQPFASDNSFFNSAEQSFASSTAAAPRYGSHGYSFEASTSAPRFGAYGHSFETPTEAPRYGNVPELKQYSDEEEKESTEKKEDEEEAKDDMPKELHQLLNLQAQIPYHVIANRIYYKPKSMFIPKPLPEDTKSPYKYRAKVYYVKDLEDAKERPQREEPKDEKKEKKIDESVGVDSEEQVA